MHRNRKATTAKATGQVIEYKGKRGLMFSIRFRANGGRRSLTLGSAEEGWTRAKALVELDNVLADVRRGIWQAPKPPPVVEEDHDPTFHEFASEWFARARGELRPNTILDYEWQLSNHLLPFFHAHRLSQITRREVDRYRDDKVRAGELSKTSINKTITRLAQILQAAVDYDLIAKNPARGKDRRCRAQRPRPIYLESAEQIETLLAAAADLDGQSRRTAGRRVLLATLVMAGLRSGEASALRWRDVDLANGRLHVRDSKTDAGVREVDLRPAPALREELTEHKAWCESVGRAGPDCLVFTTHSGERRDKDNIRSRVMAPAIKRADEMLAERDSVPLPKGLTPHKLRHTYASALLELGEPATRVMSLLGHKDPAFTLKVYAHVMGRIDDRERARLARVFGRSDWAEVGRSADGGRPVRPTPLGSAA